MWVVILLVLPLKFQSFQPCMLVFFVHNCLCFPWSFSPFSHACLFSLYITVQRKLLHRLYIAPHMWSCPKVHHMYDPAQILLH